MKHRHKHKQVWFGLSSSNRSPSRTHRLSIQKQCGCASRSSIIGPEASKRSGRNGVPWSRSINHHLSVRCPRLLCLLCDHDTRLSVHHVRWIVRFILHLLQDADISLRLQRARDIESARCAVLLSSHSSFLRFRSFQIHSSYERAVLARPPSVNLREQSLL